MQQQKTVLIADDHADTIEMTQGFLAFYDYNVTVAYNGPDALLAARQRIPDSIILDIGLPIMDGFQVARTLRESDDFAHTVIVGHSGHGGTTYYDHARSVGIDFYLIKPADPEVLLACLDPDKHPATAAECIVISASQELQRTSAELLSKARALSIRSAAAVNRAREICRRNFPQ